MPCVCCADIVDAHGSGLTNSMFRNGPDRAPGMPQSPPRSSREPVASGQVFHLISKGKWFNYKVCGLFFLLKELKS